MRLAVLATSLAGERPTGLGVYTRQVLRHTPWPGGTVFLGDRATLLRELPDEPALATPVLDNFGKRLLWQTAQLDPALRKAEADLLYAPTHELSPSIHSPFVMVVHDLIPLLFGHLSSKKLSTFFRHFLPRTCEKARALVAISEHTKADLVRHYGIAAEKIRVVPNGYDTRLFRPPDPLQAQAFRAKHGLGEYVLYVGRLSEPKNVGALVEAFARVKDEVREDLVLVGPDEKGDLAALRDRARALGIGDRLKHLAYLPHHELPVAYGAARLFATASLYEGFGLPPLEAMACGAPVVASDASAIPEVVGDAGVLVDPTDPAAIGRAMAEVLGDAAKRETLRTMGLRRAAQFSWERTGEMTRDVLDDVAVKM